MIEYVTFVTWVSVTLLPQVSHELFHHRLVFVTYFCRLVFLHSGIGTGVCGGVYVCVYVYVCRLTRKNNRDNRVHQTGRRRGATMKELLILLQFYIKKNIDHSPQ